MEAVDQRFQVWHLLDNSISFDVVAGDVLQLFNNGLIVRNLSGVNVAIGTLRFLKLNVLHLTKVHHQLLELVAVVLAVKSVVNEID